MREQFLSSFGEFVVLTPRMVVATEDLADLFNDCRAITVSELERVNSANGYGYAPYITAWREQGLIE